MIESISIPLNVTHIGKNAFANCSQLKKISFLSNSNLQIIDEYAFYFSPIESISLPFSVTQIGLFPLRYCSELKIIEVNSFIDINQFQSMNEIILMIPIENNS